ncbi:hypothetical protein [Gracilimonas mengyeensis]|uniref:Phosphate-selective porin O and P n=1 Tax=Gracilimonas mengyeensis TaxID=1302730 RepID=A0A521BGG3_9BACT|nr:hypothetical protein [Gracilimonas mengyeensis]SMO46188.1 hypothetical protein SAMN06265219_102280 [Gracilimonas mengyeensis]
MKYITLLISSFFMLFSTYAFAQEDESSLSIGGAFRYNVLLTDYEDGEITNSDGQFTWDTWRLNVNAERNGLKLNFEYRFYPTFNTHFVKQGWIGYDFNESNNVQLGVTQVPFGNLTYTSHSWWFQGPYYVGLEDDHDMGLKYTYTAENWDFMAAYFFQPEPAGPAYGAASFGSGGSGRYSYDIIPITGSNPWDYVLGTNEVAQSNFERNQLNLRATRTFSFTNGSAQVGLSGEIGQIHNSAVEENTARYALAAHTDINYGNWNFKGEFINYGMDAQNDAGQEVDYVYMAAYGDPYPVATEMNMYVAGLSYSYDVDWGPVTNLNFYNDYTLFQKNIDGYNNSHQNIIGVLVSAGNIYAYFDIARGSNQPWLTQNFGSGLAQGVNDARWNTRFNINIGYYF